MRTPIFGPFDVSRSTNLADNAIINLFPEVVETKQGKAVGALFLCPGLDVLETVGSGPIRAMRVMGDKLFVVSGTELYSVDESFVPTLLGGTGIDVTTKAQVATPQSGAGSYAPGDVVTVVGGTGTDPTFTVTDTQVAAAPAIVAAGSGGTDGAITLSGTTGTGTIFRCTGTVAAGALTGTLTLIDPGDYTVNPSDLGDEPLIDETNGTLTGALVSLKMGMLTVTPKTYGALTAAPANPASVTSSGSGTGGTLNVDYFAATIGLGGVTMIDNGKQIAVIAGDARIWSADAGFGVISLPYVLSGATISAAYMDGFGVINQPGTGFLFQSNLLDLATFDPLKFGQASGDPDDIVAVAQVRREFWLIKRYETEVWYDAGTQGFAFAILAGPYPEVGCAAVGSVALCGESLCWLAQNRSGKSFVVMTRGHDVVRISTHALDEIFRQYPSISDATGYGYTQDGHQFYVLNFTDGDATWVYDLTESAMVREPLWHQRGRFTGGAWHRHVGDNQAFFAGANVIGDYTNGNLYALNPNTLTDNGVARKWVRSWRALPTPSDEPTRFNQLRIDMQTGVNLPLGATPKVTLSWSDDGGHTWSAGISASAGDAGETAIRVMFRRLGSTRRNSGLDRIFQLTSSDAFPAVIIGADLT